MRVIQPMLEFFQLTQGCLRYLQISSRAHGEGPLPVGKSMNIRSIGLLRKFQHRSDHPNVKYTCTILFLE